MSKHRWNPFEENVLQDIINNGDNGNLRKVIIEKSTNLRMRREDAWERVMYVHLKSRTVLLPLRVPYS